MAGGETTEVVVDVEVKLAEKMGGNSCIQVLTICKTTKLVQQWNTTSQ